MTNQALYKIETYLPTGSVKIKFVTYSELMNSFTFKSFRSFLSPYYWKYYLVNKDNFPCCVFYDDKYMSWIEFFDMIEKFHRFTSVKKEKTVKKNVPAYRKDPIPYTGAVKSSMRLRSKQVLRNGLYQHVPRSNYRDRSWKTNHKVRKSWAKHKNCSVSRKTKHDLIYELNHEFFEDDLEIDEA